ncbi:MAG: TrkH family potassium uptake protein [Methanocorpusculum sp.]|uniref:TrkH family potassium uptake protein n=1 Tax=Methanocorpusculum sp. TaxID=2058474 RepID=UPI0027186B9C|nr:TrkH family potassium uptake protein [Methanocorpusculum sp.]MDO9522990.1 TrkH family potassium uptake protein [Methanocorpusculum sp.]
MGYLRELPAIGRDIGSVLLLIGAATLLPIIVGCLYQEWYALPWMATSTVAMLGIGGLLHLLPKNTKPPRASLSISATAVIWALVGFLGCFPFIFAGMPFLDAVFESMSAWTATGFSLATNLEDWPNTILLWRSLMQWIGGLGIVAFTLTVASRSGLVTQNLYRSEGGSESFMPSVIATAFQMWKIYLTLTLIAILAILLTGLSLWDAVNIAFCAIATGGMSIYADGITHFNNFALEMVLVPIMLAGAIPFRLYYVIYVSRSFREILHDRILHMLIGVFILVSAVLIVELFTAGMPLMDTLRESLFMASSVVSSTGFQNTTFAGWGMAPILFLSIFLMIEGGQGSTSGGIKLNRIQIMFEAFSWWFRKTLQSPRAVVPIRHDGKPLYGKAGETLITKSLLVILLYVLLMIGTLIVLLHDPYFSQNLAGTIYDLCSCIGNNGSSTGVIGPLMPDYSKVIIIFVMWITRLEIIPVLILIWGILRGFDTQKGTRKRDE